MPVVAEGREILQHQPRAVFAVRDRFARDRLNDDGSKAAIYDVTLTVVERREGANWVKLQRPVVLKARPNSYGYLVWFGETRGEHEPRKDRPARAGRRRETFEPGTLYRVRVDVDPPVFRTATVETPLGSGLALAKVLLEPSHLYPFPGASPLPDGAEARPGTGPTLLRGSYYVDAAGRGRAGAVVSVSEGTTQRDYETDDSGDWVFDFPDDSFPQATLDGSAVTREVNVDFIPGRGEQVLHVKATLVRGREMRLLQTAVKGRAVRRSGAPLPGATVTVDGRTERAVADAAGVWSIHFPPEDELRPPPPRLPDATPSLPAPPPTVDLVATSPSGVELRKNQFPLRPGRAADAGDFVFD